MIRGSDEIGNKRIWKDEIPIDTIYLIALYGNSLGLKLCTQIASAVEIKAEESEHLKTLTEQ